MLPTTHRLSPSSCAGAGSTRPPAVQVCNSMGTQRVERCCTCCCLRVPEWHLPVIRHSYTPCYSQKLHVSQVCELIARSSLLLTRCPIHIPTHPTHPHASTHTLAHTLTRPPHPHTRYIHTRSPHNSAWRPAALSFRIAGFDRILDELERVAYDQDVALQATPHISLS